MIPRLSDIGMPILTIADYRVAKQILCDHEKRALSSGCLSLARFGFRIFCIIYQSHSLSEYFYLCMIKCVFVYRVNSAGGILEFN